MNNKYTIRSFNNINIILYTELDNKFEIPFIFFDFIKNKNMSIFKTWWFSIKY